MTVLVTRRRFTVDEYECMGTAGILGEDDRVELLNGEIIEMAPIGSRHAGCVKELNRLFSGRAAGRYIVSVQDPVRLSSSSEPEPDIALLRPREDGYRTSHPQPEDVLLIIEVADSSLDVDRRVKVRLFAEAGIPEVWLANLQRPSITAYREPQDGRYRRINVFRRGSSIAPLAFPDIEPRVEDILGHD